MNKALIIVVVLLLTGLAGGYKTVSDISRDRSTIVYTQNNVYGDSSVLQGLEIKADLWGGQDNIVWHSDFRFTDSDYSYSTEVEYTAGQMIYHSYYENMPVNLFLLDDQSMDTPQLAQIMESYYQEYSEGNYRDKTIKLKDYLDYYPISALFNVSTELSMKYPKSVFYDKDYENGDVDEYNKTKINQYFRIQVSDDDYITIQGNQGNGVNADTSKTYHVSTMCAANDDTVFLYVSNRKSEEKKVIIEPGYGIFSIPYGHIDQYDYKGVYRYTGMDIDVDNIRMFYPLNEDEIMWGMHNNTVSGNLQIITKTDGKFVFRVISYEGELLQEISLGDAEETFNFVYDNENLIVRLNGRYIQVYELNNGRYQLALNADSSIYDNLEVKTEQFGETTRYRNMKYHYDGTRLTAVGVVPSGNYFTLAVYDREKLLYAGWYDSDVSGSYRSKNSISINWN